MTRRNNTRRARRFAMAVSKIFATGTWGRNERPRRPHDCSTAARLADIGIGRLFRRLDRVGDCVHAVLFRGHAGLVFGALMNVKATLIPWTEPPMDAPNGRWFGPKGAFIQQEGISGSSWSLCCPGCGELGGPSKGASWQIIAGSFGDVAKLTLQPSVHCRGCCGWHGYLTDGEFRSC